MENSLIERLEYKYLISINLMDSIRREISPFVELDPYAKKQENGRYIVRTIYLDTSELECYHSKIEGINIRKKYRIRGYDYLTDNDVVFLEIKRKCFDHISKNRAPLYYQNIQSFFNTKNFDENILSFSQNGKERKDAQKFLFHYYSKGLHPVVLIIYEREAFFGKFDSSLRLTFDKNLRSRIFPSLDMLFDDEPVKFSMTQYFIFEVKFSNNLPAWLKSLLNRYNLKRRALSKYIICIDSHKEPKIFSRSICSHRLPTKKNLSKKAVYEYVK